MAPGTRNHRATRRGSLVRLQRGDGRHVVRRPRIQRGNVAASCPGTGNRGRAGRPARVIRVGIAHLRRTTNREYGGRRVDPTLCPCAESWRPAGAPPGPTGHQGSEAIRARDDLRMSLDDAAQLAFLSPSRFAHLFKDQVGLPYSRYMLWRKLTRAMVAIASERTIAAAAQAADFADAAHLTRTFYQMVGMAPSVLMRGKFAEIPSPFFRDSDSVSAAAPVPRPSLR